MLHSDEVRITPEVAHRLIAIQFSAWADLPIRELDTDGTVHAIYRMGDEMAARFPLRPADPADIRRLLETEAAAAGELARCNPVPTPEPIAIGEPGPGYPLPWAVQSWIRGTTAAEEDPGDSVTFAGELAAFIGALRLRTPTGEHLAGPTGVVIYPTTTRGCRRASASRPRCWTSSHCVDAGPSFEICHGSTLT